MTKRQYNELGLVGVLLAVIFGLFTFVAYEEPGPIGFFLALGSLLFGLWAFSRARAIG